LNVKSTISYILVLVAGAGTRYCPKTQQPKPLNVKSSMPYILVLVAGAGTRYCPKTLQPKYQSLNPRTEPVQHKLFNAIHPGAADL